MTIGSGYKIWMTLWGRYMNKLLESEKVASIEKSDAIDILDRTIDFVRNCDNKASIFLGVFGVIVTIVLTTDGVDNLTAIFNAAIAQLSFCNVLYLAMMVGAVVAVVFGLSQIIRVLGVKVDPLKEEGIENDSKIFFESIKRNVNYIAYKAKLLSMSDEEFLNDVTSQIYINACICSDKYKNYKCGLKWSLIGFIAFVVLWAIGTILF
jgi:hypothetical protein